MIDPLENGTISLIFGLSGQLLTHSMLVYVNPVAPVPGIHKKKTLGSRTASTKKINGRPWHSRYCRPVNLSNQIQNAPFLWEETKQCFHSCIFLSDVFLFNCQRIFSPYIHLKKKKNLQLARCSLGKLLKNHLLGCGKFVAFLPVVAILPGPSKST